MNEQESDVKMLRYDESRDLVNSIEDQITRNLMNALSFCIIRRFLTKKELPISDFDIGFFSNAMLDVCRDHGLI
jgi:hypothetical protein